MQDNSKDNSSRWLEGVPKDWTVCALNHRYEVALGKMLDEKRITGRNLGPYLRNVDVQWGHINTLNLPLMDFVGVDLTRYALHAGDLLVCEGGEVGRAAVWRGEVEPCFYQKALHRLRPRDHRIDEPQFLYYGILAAANAGAFSEGRSTISHLTAEKLRRYPFPFPPEAVQKEIAAFLDGETTRIGELIVKKQRQTEVLVEREEASILRIVTGANRAGSRRASGIDWIGSTPIYWETPKFTHVARQETGHTPSRKEDSYWVPEECVIPWFSLADVWQIREGTRVYVLETAEKISQRGMDNSAARLLPASTVILSRTASVGFPAILGMPMATTQDFVGWICGKRLRPKYLYYVLRAMKPEFRRLMMGSTHQTIYMPDIRSFRTPLPPLAEQDQIVAELDEITGRFRTAVEKITASVDKLREYRAALITAAVTGQIDVRQPMIRVATKPDRARLRVLVGAEIVARHHGNVRFGRVKHQKLLFLAEAHAGITELGGQYRREAAGPFDRALIAETERGMEAAGLFRAAVANGETGGVTYVPLQNAGQHRAELAALLGPRTEALRGIVDLLRDFDTTDTEAVATLYAVWNDEIMDGHQPSDDAIVHGVLNDWHPEKRVKFKDADLRHWLDWMKRNGLVPTGRGPRTISTSTPDLFR